jgi:pimeloyl-ACP methyl ester carboxylesterase
METCGRQLSAVRLRHGPRLTYEALGRPRGFPVLYMHGAIGSPRWRSPALDAAVASLGLRCRVPVAGFRVPVAGPLAYDAALRMLHARSATAARTMIDDLEVCRAPWGFDPSEVTVPIVLWHGARDRLVPARHALRLGAALPACATRLEPRAGHFFFSDRVTDIIESVIAA